MSLTAPMHPTIAMPAEPPDALREAIDRVRQTTPMSPRVASPELTAVTERLRNPATKPPPPGPPVAKIPGR
jgi:hypothetical protein